jgi:hypothetical protein
MIGNQSRLAGVVVMMRKVSLGGEIGAAFTVVMARAEPIWEPICDNCCACPANALDGRFKEMLPAFLGESYFISTADPIRSPWLPPKLLRKAFILSEVSSEAAKALEQSSIWPTGDSRKVHCNIAQDISRRATHQYLQFQLLAKIILNTDTSHSSLMQPQSSLIAGYLDVAGILCLHCQTHWVLRSHQTAALSLPTTQARAQRSARRKIM